MIIDFHTHCFPDELARKTIPHLSKISGFLNVTDGTLGGILENMQKNNVDVSVVLNIATNPHQEEKVNDFAISLDKNKNIVSFGSVHPEGNWEYTLDKLKDNGIKGIKLHPDYQGFFIDEARMNPVYEGILKRDFVLIFHTGVDDGIGEPTHATPERIKNVLGMFRSQKVVLAHMGGFRMQSEAFEKIVGEDIYLDTSCSAEFIEKDYFEKMVISHGVDKILYATDLPWTNPQKEIGLIESLDISKEEKEKIFYKNAYKLLNL